MGLQILPGSPTSSCSKGFSEELEPSVWGARRQGRHQAPLTCVVQVPSPLVVVGLLGEHGFGDELLGLVVEVVVEVIPQEQVQERGLAVGVMAQCGRAEPGVQEAAGWDKESGKREENRGIKFRDSSPTGPIPPPDHIEFVQEFVDAGVVIVTLGHHQVQGPAVLGADLLHQIIGHFLSLQEEKGGQGRGLIPGEAETTWAVRLSLGKQPNTAGMRGQQGAEVGDAQGAGALQGQLRGLTSGYLLLFIR